MKFNLSLILTSILLILSSCGSTKKIPYMIDAETIPQSVLQQASQASEPIVMPGDLLDITVTSINLDAVRPFNKIDFLQQLAASTLTNNNNYDQNKSIYYLVDNDGYIEFPVLGKLYVSGKSKEEIKEMIVSGIYPKYLTEKPGVDIRFKNFKVSVLGEVKSPGVYTASNEHITIFEAIALAGDLNITGMRENVMLIRTNADGSKNIQRLNLNDKNIVLSPYYNLQQNDVIYVQPNSSKARSSWSIPPALSLTLSSIGTVISIATLVVTIVK